MHLSKAKNLKKLLPYVIQNKKLVKNWISQRNQWKEKQGRTDSEVTPDDIAQVVASWTGIPVSKIAEEETQRFSTWRRSS